MAKRYGRTLISDGAARGYAFDAHLSGARAADYSGDCMAPVVVPLTGQPALLTARLGELAELEHYGPMARTGIDMADGRLLGSFADIKFRNVDLEVRCRKCANCLKARASLWRHRAQVELRASQRSWFGTLTLSPERHFHCANVARARLAGWGDDWDALSVTHPEYAWKERLKPLVAEWQRYFKRLRKAHAGLRYLLVVEAHKSGLPHLHCMIHETCGPIRHATLQAQWQWGFTRFNLVSEDALGGAARYVTKYLTKSMSARVIASRGYGRAQL